MAFSDWLFLVWSPGHFDTKFWLVGWVVLAVWGKTQPQPRDLEKAKISIIGELGLIKLIHGHDSVFNPMDNWFVVILVLILGL